MIDDYVQFKDGALTIEANWNEAVKPAQKFRFTVYDGGKKQSVIVDREHIFQILFLFSTEEQKESIIPVQSTQTERFNRRLKLRLKKDMKKGEILYHDYSIFIPTMTIQKIVLDNRKNLMKKKHGI